MERGGIPPQPFVQQNAPLPQAGGQGGALLEGLQHAEPHIAGGNALQEINGKDMIFSNICKKKKKKKILYKN